MESTELKKLTKNQLIEKLQQEKEKAQYYLTNSTIIINPNKGKNSKTLHNLSKAILKVANLLEEGNKRPVYGVVMGDVKSGEVES